MPPMVESGVWTLVTGAEGAFDSSRPRLMSHITQILKIYRSDQTWSLDPLLDVTLVRADISKIDGPAAFVADMPA